MARDIRSTLGGRHCFIPRSAWWITTFCGWMLVLPLLLVSNEKNSGCVEAVVRFWPPPFMPTNNNNNKKSKYTPLLFFTYPPGTSPEVDAVEKSVKQIERQLNVRVERMDLMRKPENQAVLRSVAPGMTPPYLYNRESLQVYYISPTKKKTDDDESSSSKYSPSVYVDTVRIRAWAKGRYLPPKTEQKIGGVKVFAPKLVQQQQDEDTSEQEELLEEMTMTPLQRKGKQAMKERTEELARRNAAKANE